MSNGEGGVADDPAEASLAEAYLAHHFAFRPVDATFMGEGGYDHLLPDASAGAAAAERAGAEKLLSWIDAAAGEDSSLFSSHAERGRWRDAQRRDGGGVAAAKVSDLTGRQQGRPPHQAAHGPFPPLRRGREDSGCMGGGSGKKGEVGARLDLRLAHAQLATVPDAPSRFANPAWYTGEAAFGVIGLLLPQSAPTRRDALAARLAAIPDFLADGHSRLAAQPVPRGFVRRAEREAAAMAAFLIADIRLYPDWDDGLATGAQAAARAFASFAEGLADLPDRSVACGRAYLETLMHEAHGLDLDADEAVRRAQAAFDDLGEELVDLAATLDPQRSWGEQIEALGVIGPQRADDVLDRYRQLDRRAAVDGGSLVTVATGYGLDYGPLDPCFRNVASALYFLSYRSPPAANPGAGSVYWVAPPAGDEAAYLRANTDATVKIVHAVHHGSVGHHTQNAAARASPSRLARLAGTDCALGLAFLSAGSMVEGWACYVQDMMREPDGFYTPAEGLLLKQMERRNAASVLVDVRLHTGEWSPEQACAFYRDEAGFAPSRVEAEVTRNAMLPATRLMYWLGVEHIRGLRARWRGDTRAFHDTLIGYGHVPVAWAGEEMARAGLLR